MKKLKSCFGILLAISIITQLAACGGATVENVDSGSNSAQSGASSTEPIVDAETNLPDDAPTLIFAHVHQADAESSEIHSQALYIQKELAKAGIKVEIYPASTLGGQTDINEAMRMGNIDMSICGTSTFSTVAPRIAICDFPYLWKDFDHIAAVMDGEIGEGLKDELDGSGLHIISFSRSWGFRYIGLCEKKATSFDELKGLKVRTIQSEISIGAMEAMNVSPTPLAMGDVYSSLQTGLLDGFEHTAATTMMNKWNEVCKYYLLTEHQEPELCTVVSMQTWDKLTDEQKEAVQKACDEAAKECSDKALDKDAEYKKQLEESGVEIIEVDKAPFIESADKFNQSYAEKIGVIELYNQIVEVGKDYP